MCWVYILQNIMSHEDYIYEELKSIGKVQINMFLLCTLNSKEACCGPCKTKLE